MTEEKNNENKKDLIGVDPLAWMSEEEKESIQDESNAESNSNPESGKQNDSIYRVELNTSLTIREASTLLEELNHIEDTHQEIILDAEQLERVDTAAMQLLLGFSLFAIKEGKKIIWHKPTETVLHAVNILGLNDVLKLNSASA